MSNQLQTVMASGCRHLRIESVTVVVNFQSELVLPILQRDLD